MSPSVFLGTPGYKYKIEYLIRDLDIAHKGRKIGETNAWLTQGVLRAFSRLFGRLTELN